jgi:hypothetical protein
MSNDSTWYTAGGGNKHVYTALQAFKSRNIPSLTNIVTGKKVEQWKNAIECITEGETPHDKALAYCAAHPGSKIVHGFGHTADGIFTPHTFVADKHGAVEVSNAALATQSYMGISMTPGTSMSFKPNSASWIFDRGDPTDHIETRGMAEADAARRADRMAAHNRPNVRKMPAEEPQRRARRTHPVIEKPDPSLRAGQTYVAEPPEGVYLYSDTVEAPPVEDTYKVPMSCGTITRNKTIW